MDENKIKEEANEFARKHKKEIVKSITDKSIYHSQEKPISIFMAGSPGAGKTEFSKNLLAQFETSRYKVLRLDPDEFREKLPGYTGVNSYLFQRAVSAITDKVLDNLFHNKQDFILDGTFSHYGPAEKNIIRSIEHKRLIYVFFVYQNPLTAWQVTQKREEQEHRNIPKDIFIEEFFATQETVMKIKETFKDNILLYFVDKEASKETTSVYSTDSIYRHLIKRFTKEELGSILKE